MSILIIEDEAGKLEDLHVFFTSRYPQQAVATAKSVRSAVDWIRGEKDFQLIALDMSLPTFDVSRIESGGAPKGFGGIEVLRYLQKDGISTPVIVVTAYEAFTEGPRIVSLDDLRQQLLIEFPENFQGLVYYNVLYRDWMDSLEILSNAVLRDE
jgi:CheY-like chemotaxis protein